MAKSSFYCVLLLVAVVMAERPGQDRISWQAHSRDDLREWPQLLLKGTSHFKVDAHFITTRNPLWDSLCSAETAPCFAMTHDDPIAGVAYNLTSELHQLLLRAPNVASKLTIALCFKGYGDASSACNATDPSWRDWLDAASALLAGLAHTGASVVVDGDGTPGGVLPQRSCLCDQFGTLGSTWSGSRDPPQGALSDKGCFARFSVFNPPTAGWEAMALFRLDAALNFGKWGDQAHVKTPLQVWEPQDAADFETIETIWADTPAGGKTTLLFALNTDSVQFTAYKRPRQTIASLQFDADGGLAAELPHGVATADAEFHLAAMSDQESTTVDIAASNLEGSVVTRVHANISRAVPDLQLAATVSGAGYAGADLFYFLLSNGSLVFRSAKADAVVVAQFPISQILGVVNSTQLHCSKVDDGTTACTGLAVGAGAADATSAKIMHFQIEFGPGTVTLLSSSNLRTCESSCKVLAGSITVATFNQTGFFAYASSESQICAAAISISGAGEVVVGRSRLVTVGTFVSASACPLTGRFTMSTRDSFCWSSHTGNTRASPKVCDQQPESTSRVNGYTTGTIASFVQLLQAPTAKLSACAPGVLHGASGQGHGAPASAVAGSNWLFVTGCLNATERTDVGGCGMPLSCSTGNHLVLSSQKLRPLT